MPKRRPSPSRELWHFSLTRLRQLKGSSAPQATLGRMLGFDSSQLGRWKNGTMHMDRAKHLLLLSALLEVDVVLLVHVAAGLVSGTAALNKAGPPRAPSAVKPGRRKLKPRPLRFKAKAKARQAAAR